MSGLGFRACAAKNKWVIQQCSRNKQHCNKSEATPGGVFLFRVLVVGIVGLAFSLLSAFSFPISADIPLSYDETA